MPFPWAAWYALAAQCLNIPSTPAEKITQENKIPEGRQPQQRAEMPQQDRQKNTAARSPLLTFPHISRHFITPQCSLNQVLLLGLVFHATSLKQPGSAGHTTRHHSPEGEALNTDLVPLSLIKQRWKGHLFMSTAIRTRPWRSASLLGVGGRKEIQLSVLEMDLVLHVCVHACAHMFYREVFIIRMQEKYISPGPLAYT